MLSIGVYYYPEAWPAAQWPRDMANIKKLGLEFVHMGEFAWAFMEPTEGNFDFAGPNRNVSSRTSRASRSFFARPRRRRRSG